MDMLKWIDDMRNDCERIGDDELTRKFEHVTEELIELHNAYYKALDNGDVTTCQAIIVGLADLSSSFIHSVLPFFLKESSPIEKLMWQSLQFSVNRKDWENFYFQPQVNVVDDKYRVDFGVFSQNPNDYLPAPFLAIECDGFNYHHANKEQVSKDNNRIREIQFAGIEVLRVSGYIFSILST
ncbi:MAG: hypothetical protein FWC73_04975 [Defluviitaleaceae bacterium]|nr:hypothetical protein [Defluviitaleaceae bacterium]